MEPYRCTLENSDGPPLGRSVPSAAIIGGAAFVVAACLLAWSMLGAWLAPLPFSAAAGLVVWFLARTRIPAPTALMALATVVLAVAGSGVFVATWGLTFLASLASAMRGRHARTLDATTRTLALVGGWLAVHGALVFLFVLLMPLSASSTRWFAAPAWLVAAASLLVAAIRDERVRRWLRAVRAGDVPGWTVRDLDAELPDVPWLHFDRVLDSIGPAPLCSALMRGGTVVALIPRNPSWPLNPTMVGVRRGVGRALVASLLALASKMLAAAAHDHVFVGRGPRFRASS